MAEIHDIQEPWEDHSGDEVEQFLKAKLTELAGGMTYLCQVNIVGSTAKSYSSGATDVRFQYRINNLVNGEFDANVSVTIEVNGQLLPVQRPSVSSSEDVVESPNIAPFLRNATGANDIVSIYAFTSEQQSATRTIRYTCMVARIVAGNSFRVARINPPSLPFLCQFSTNTADIMVESRNVVGGGDVCNYAVGGIRSSETDETVVPIQESEFSGVRIATAALSMNGGTGESERVQMEYINVGMADRYSRLVASMPVSGAVQYEAAELAFGVYNADQETAEVRVEILDGNGNTIFDSVVSCQCSTFDAPSRGYTSRLTFRPTTTTGTINYYIDGALIRQTSYTAAGSDVNWTPATDGLILHLSAQGKDNAQVDAAEWSDHGIVTEFVGVDFDSNTSAAVSNGWRDGRSLHLTGRAKAIIRIPLFYDTTRDANGNNFGILRTGRSFTVKFSVSDITDANTIAIKCWEAATSLGFYIRPDAIYARLGAELVNDVTADQAASTNTRRFCSNTEVEVTFTVGKCVNDDGQRVNPEMRMYVNGEVAAVSRYSGDRLSHNVATYVELGGGGGCSLDVYSVRAYDRALSPTEVLRNYVMDQQSQSVMTALYAKNRFNINTFTPEKDNSGNYQGIFGYCSERSKAGSPCAIIVTTDLRRGITDTGVAAPGKHSIEIYYFRDGEIDETMSVKYAAAVDGGLRVRVQGTSTASMSEKNLRYDARSGGCYEYRWRSGAWVQVSHPEDTTNNDNRVYKLAICISSEDDIPCTLLTTKTNYNESTATRNLPMAMWTNDAINALADNYPEYKDLLTPPQQEDRRVRQTINGVPAVQYYYDGASYSFAGKVDIITDKSNQGVFGFTTDGDHSIEFRNNGSDQCNFKSVDFRTVLEDTLPSNQSYLQYRYPDAKTKWGDAFLNNDSPFIKFAKFVYDCDPDNVGKVWDLATNKPVNTNPSVGISIKGRVPYYIDNNGAKVYTLEKVDNVTFDYETVDWKGRTDNAYNRRMKFYAELHNYAVANCLVFNGLVSNVLLWTDQRAKNQFFTVYAVEALVRLLAYDIDTSMRGDNDSRLRYDFTRLYEDPGIYDDAQSALYRLLDYCFQREYAVMFGRLAQLGFFTFDGIARYYKQKQVDAYSPTIYNADTDFKYLADVSEDGGASDQRYKAHGSAVEDLDWWVQGRMYFMAGRYYDGTPTDYTASAVNINLTDNCDISAVTLHVQSYVRNYVRIYYAGKGARTIYNEAYVNGAGNGETMPVDLSYIGRTGSSDNRLYVYGARQIRSMGDMSGLQVASIVGSLNTVDLLIGRYENGYKNTSFSGFDSSAIYGACREVNVGNCTRIAALTLRNFPVLEVLEARGCDAASSLELPPTETPRVLHLPANLASLTIHNKPNIEVIDLQGRDSLTEINVSNVSNTAAAFAFDTFTKLYK